MEFEGKPSGFLPHAWVPFLEVLSVCAWAGALAKPADFASLDRVHGWGRPWGHVVPVSGTLFPASVW